MSTDETYGCSRQYGTHDQHVQRESSCSNSSFDNDFSTQEIDLDQVDSRHEDNQPYMIRWKSGEKVDPRMLTVLESFRELYVSRREFFKKVFPGIYDESVDVFNKIGSMIRTNKKMKSPSLVRSLSLGEEREVEKTAEGSDQMRLENFKVKTLGSDQMRPQRFKVKNPKVIVAGSDGQGDQTDQGATDSGSK